MEKRALIAVTLAVVVLVGWQLLVGTVSTPPPPPRPESGQAPTPVAPAGQPLPGVGGVSGPPAPRPSRLEGPGSGSSAEVRTPLYRVSFDGDGAVSAWDLDYRGIKPLAVGSALRPLTVAISQGSAAAEIVSLRPDRDRVEIRPGGAPASLTFSGRTSGGLRIERTLRLMPDTYRIEVELRLEAGEPASEPLSLVLYWTGSVAIFGPTRETPPLTFGEGAGHTQVLGRMLVAAPGKSEAYDAPSPALRDPKESPGGPELKDPLLVARDVLAERRWVALENDYFIAALIPPAGARVLRARERDGVEVGVVFSGIRLEAGRPWEGRTSVFVGPKEWDRLAALGVGLEQAQARNYGHFPVPEYGLPMEWFCVPLLWLMNFLASHLPGQNYGVAIVLLTVLVKIAFYPLTHKSMTSMKQMQVLQPQINALRSKYKSDTQRFQREQMELFRKHRVNPMGGCLPMVVQIPVFYALYLTLQYSVELQGAPLGMWVTDLSKKDPYYVLPILMGISMLVQQKMTPTVGDPRQAKVMLIMPVIFTFMFLEFPTGLVLYWLVNNCLSIAQQYLIDQTALRAKGKSAVEPPGEKEARKA